MDEKRIAYWEHMMHCINDGIATHLPIFSFRANLVYLFHDLLGQETDLPKALPWRDTVQLWGLRMGLRHIPYYVPSCVGVMSRAFIHEMFRAKAKVDERKRGH